MDIRANCVEGLSLLYAVSAKSIGYIGKLSPPSAQCFQFSDGDKDSGTPCETYVSGVNTQLQQLVGS